MPDFPNQVQTIQAPAVEGDFSSANPRATVQAGEGGLVCGDGVDVAGGPLVGGIIVGRFGWLSYKYADSDNAPAVVNTFGAGKPDGLVHRIQVGLITKYLASASMVLLGGQQTTLFREVDMWIKNRGATAAQRGMKAFAKFADGTARFAAAGSAANTASGATSSVAASTFTGTGSISGNVLTITTWATGQFVNGGTISGTGVAAGTKIVQQLTSTETDGALGKKGTYALSIPEQTVASTAISGTYGTLTVGGAVTGQFAVGQTISGAGVVAGTTITQLLTGAGGAGTYVVDNNTVVAATAITAAVDIETDFIADSSGLPGELVKVRRVN